MNRRKFIAGFMVSTAPMVVVGATPLLPALSDICVPLPYKDPSIVFVDFHKRMNAAYRLTMDACAANIREELWSHTGRPLRETLHDVS